jgi:hypothetical protein
MNMITMNKKHLDPMREDSISRCRAKHWFFAAILVICGLSMTMTSCSKDDDDDVVVPTPEESVVLNCAKPDYLKAGDRVAMLSPS